MATWRTEQRVNTGWLQAMKNGARNAIRRERGRLHPVDTKELIKLAKEAVDKRSCSEFTGNLD